MKILICPLEPSLEFLFRELLQIEGYAVTSIALADEALRTIEESSEPVIVLADNIHFNDQAQALLTALGERPDMRRRVRAIFASASRERITSRQHLAAWMDDFLPLPFSGEQLVACIASNASQLP